MTEAADQPSGLPVPNSTSSFWHSEPSEFLLGHRTTPELPAEADVVIVGSGITGASAARFLVEDPRYNGRSVVMLEAREACWGATGRNGGSCNSCCSVRGALSEYDRPLPGSPRCAQRRRRSIRGVQLQRCEVLRHRKRRRV